MAFMRPSTIWAPSGPGRPVLSLDYDASEFVRIGDRIR